MTTGVKLESAGHPRLVPELLRRIIIWYTLRAPTATRKEIISFVRFVGGPSLSLQVITRELQRAGFTKKKVRPVSYLRDPIIRAYFWINTPAPNPQRGWPGSLSFFSALALPFHSLTPSPGVFGVPAERLIDIDESGVHLYDANRRYGHNQRGHRIEVGGHSTNPGKRYNIIAAVGVNEGVFVRWVLEENNNKHTMMVFLKLWLLPRIRGQQRILMWDNASFHLGDKLRRAIESEGHLLLQRPPYSPDFAPIESLFSKMKMYLRSISHEVNETTIKRKIYEGIDAVTPGDVAGWFVNCHYVVTGQPYHPFLGD